MIVVFLLKKPSDLSTTAECLDTGVGALNIEDSCVALAGEDLTKRQNQQKMEGAVDFGVASGLVGSSIMTYKKEGRWPANVLICNDVCSEGMDEQSGVRPTGAWCRHKDKAHHFGGAKGEEYDNWKTLKEPPSGASRYFKKVSR
jgi:hypothetical protein